MTSRDSDNSSRHESRDETRDLETLESTLRELAHSTSGIELIYDSLAAASEQFGLSDVVVVVANDFYGTQLFHVGPRVVSAAAAARFGAQPGAYCDPQIMPAAARTLLYETCQGVFSALEEARVRPDMPASVARTSRAKASASPLLADLAVFVAMLARAYGPVRGTRTSRATLSAFLVLADFSTLVVTLADVHGPVRYLLGLVLGIAIPGWTVVGLLSLKNPALEWGLTIAMSLTIIMIVAQVMITIKLWHPVALEELLCIVCFPSLLWQSRTSQPAPGHSP
jgi:hypothetical protein